MPANLTTFAHFSVSATISLPKSAGEPGSVVPCSAKRSFILGSTKAALISLLAVDDLGGRVAGCAHPLECARFISGQEFAERWDVAQFVRARCGRDRQRAQPACPYVLDGPRHGAK